MFTKMLRFAIIVLFILGGIRDFSVAQEVLTYKSVLELALKNNFNIRLADNNREAADENVTLGNAGFLPTVNLNARRNVSNLDSDLEFFDGTQISREGAETKVLNASLDLNWRLFDGTRMFLEYKRLGLVSEIQKQQLFAEVNAVLSEVSLTYQQVIRLEESVQILQQGLEISRDRLNLEKTKLAIGTGSELNMLQAQTDFNADSSAYLRQFLLFTTIKLQLFNLLALDAGQQENIQFREEIWESHPLSLDEILTEVTKMNPDLKRQHLAELERLIAIRQIQAEYLPELDFNLGYSYNDQESEANQLRFLTTQGLNYNFTARLNIFQGFNQSRRIQQAKLQQKNVQLQSEQIRVNLENQTRIAWVNYKQTGSVFNLETTNFEAAEKTLDISKEKYNQGLMSAVEFREAQRNWLNARLRLLNAEYDVRIHEIELMRLSGKFLREKK